MAKQADAGDPLYATTDKRVAETHVIFRHGDRAPTANYFEKEARNGRNHSAAAEKLYWKLQMPASRVHIQLSNVASISNSTMGQLKGSRSYPYGCLTMSGVIGSIRLGEKLRKRYASLIDSSVPNSELVKARALFTPGVYKHANHFWRGFWIVAQTSIIRSVVE